MFEKIGRLAETAATNVSMSRRGFLGRSMHLAGGAALGMALLLAPTRAWARSPSTYKCHCCTTPFGCSPNDVACIEYCGNYCLSLKRCNPYK
jgi:hypothetical protein